GCTRFTEHWDKSTDDLLVDAAQETFASAGVDKDTVDAYWLGTAQSGMSGITLARPLQLEGKPVTRVENFCATGSEALRQAAYAVASGAYDVAMAVGAEKVKDSGYAGLNAFPVPGDGTARTLTAAAMFSMVAPAYAKRYGVDEDEIKDVLARIAWKNHSNGARNPRAQFRREMSMEAICASPRVAGPLGILDCAGVADGAASAIVVLGANDDRARGTVGDARAVQDPQRPRNARRRADRFHAHLAPELRPRVARAVGVVLPRDAREHVLDLVLVDAVALR